MKTSLALGLIAALALAACGTEDDGTTVDGIALRAPLPLGFANGETPACESESDSCRTVTMRKYISEEEAFGILQEPNVAVLAAQLNMAPVSAVPSITYSCGTIEVAAGFPGSDCVDATGFYIPALPSGFYFEKSYIINVSGPIYTFNLFQLPWIHVEDVQVRAGSLAWVDITDFVSFGGNSIVGTGSYAGTITYAAGVGLYSHVYSCIQGFRQNNNSVLINPVNITQCEEVVGTLYIDVTDTTFPLNDVPQMQSSFGFDDTAMTDPNGGGQPVTEPTWNVGASIYRLAIPGFVLNKEHSLVAYINQVLFPTNWFLADDVRAAMFTNYVDGVTTNMGTAPAFQYCHVVDLQAGLPTYPAYAAERLTLTGLVQNACNINDQIWVRNP